MWPKCDDPGLGKMNEKSQGLFTRERRELADPADPGLATESGPWHDACLICDSRLFIPQQVETT